MANIHLKLYNFSELEHEIMQRQYFKQEFTMYNRELIQEYKRTNTEDRMAQQREDEAPEDEIKIVEELLERLQFDSDAKHLR